MKLFIVSGLSGSGKSVALHTLEDENFYCIDNLHLGLLPAFVEQLERPGLKLYYKAAVGIDARSGVEDLQRFPKILEEIKASGQNVNVMFLTADMDTLLIRFSETRRKHPLTRKGLPLVEAIQLEHALLEDIAACADFTIDTSQTNIHQLRSLVRERVRAQDGTGLSLLFQSFGYKHGLPPDSDYVFDVRCLPNPNWVAELRERTGQDPAVVRYLHEHPQVEQMYVMIRDFLEHSIPSFDADDRSYLSVSLGCTGGRHRSVYLAERLSDHFKTSRGDNVSTRHRELE